MRGAFVVQFGPESNPAEDRLEGWVEEVDTCIELRFHSTAELLKFMGLRLDLVKGSSGKTRACEAPQEPSEKKPPQRPKKAK